MADNANVAPSPPAATDQAPQDNPNQEATGTEAPETPVAKFKLGEEEFDEATIRGWKETASKAEQLKKQFYAKSEEAARARKEAEEIAEAFASDPRKAFKKYGKDARDWAERMILEDLTAQAQQQEFERDPQAKKRYEEMTELEQLRADKKAREEAEKEAALEAEAAKARDHYGQLFQKALEVSGLPANENTVRRMATLQMKALDLVEAGQLRPEDVTAEGLAEAVREQIAEELRASLASYDSDDKLLAFMGDELTQRVRKANLAKLQSKPVAPVTPPAQTAPKNKRMTEAERRKEALERLDRIRAGQE